MVLLLILWGIRTTLWQRLSWLRNLRKDLFLPLTMSLPGFMFTQPRKSGPSIVKSLRSFSTTLLMKNSGLTTTYRSSLGKLLWTLILMNLKTIDLCCQRSLSEDYKTLISHVVASFSTLLRTFMLNLSDGMIWPAYYDSNQRLELVSQRLKLWAILRQTRYIASRMLSVWIFKAQLMGLRVSISKTSQDNNLQVDHLQGETETQ